MALARVMGFMEFMKKVESLDPKRYELWHDRHYVALVPQVSSRHAHTYVYDDPTREELDACIQAWNGSVLRVKEIQWDKW